MTMVERGYPCFAVTLPIDLRMLDRATGDNLGPINPEDTRWCLVPPHPAPLSEPHESKLGSILNSINPHFHTRSQRAKTRHP